MFQGRKIIVLLVSLLAACLLWLYVITTVAPEINVRISSIPVTVEGSILLEERGLLVSDVATQSITLELNTSRANLSRLSASNIRISADVSRIREAGEYDLSYTVTFPDTVRNSDVDILRKSSDTVHVTVTKVITKPVPVTLEWTGSVQDGFLFESKEVQLDPMEVVVEGPDYEVNQVSRAVVSYDVSRLEQTQIVQLPLTILDENNQPITFSEHTTVSASEVSVTMPVLQTKNLTMRVELDPGGGVREENVEVEIDPPAIQVKGSSDVLHEISDELVLGTISLSSIEEESTVTFPITLQKGVASMSGETEAVVTVRIKDVTTEKISVDQFYLIHQPEGFNTAVVNKVVTVTIRGSQTMVEQVKNDKDNGIYVLVDAAAYTGTGQYGLTGTVIHDKYPDLGIVGEPEVNITITVPEPPPTEPVTEPETEEPAPED